MIKQVSPDGGTSEFWYDKLSRLVVSQNSEQKTPTDPAAPANRYSFTKYDALGRIREVGEKTSGTDITTINLSNQSELSSWYAQGTDKSLAQTVYDKPPVAPPAGAIFENLRHRVSASIFRETRDALKINATYFSYDISGNAKTVYQEIGELKALDNTTGIKKLEYDFDLVSGKVNMLTYQKDKGDQFFYKYEYDADNRVKEALTSRNGSSWNLEARYSYYLHGPLARVELGSNEVQGIDYAYTLAGWLKAINGKDLIPGDDIGGDGTTFSAAKNFSRDELAFTLGYFNGDYAPIGGASANAISRKFEPEVFPVGTPYAGTGAPLYNGNISTSTLQIAPEILGTAKGYTYRYDQLNRLLTMRQHTGLPTGHGSIWNKTSETDDYKENITYDANGNILTFLRNSSGASLMDDLTYHYNKDAKGNVLNNKLRHVGEVVASSAFDVDIDNQPIDNYAYDKVGNLISDISEGLINIKWTPYGKTNSIQKTNSVIHYDYDATGNRVWKSSNNAEKRTFYVRDPQGNVLAVYDYNAPSGSGGQGGTLSWAEQHLYGSQRLGLWTPEITVTNDWLFQQSGVNTFLEGKRTYELTNHLGNVLATINDRKIAVDQDNNGINDYFRADLLSVTDYYAFGMQMPGRKWSLGNYRYGFNGQEMSNEIKGGEGNSYTAEFWEYDARLGRRWNMDPVYKHSPYEAFAGNPILFSDPLGLDTISFNHHKTTFVGKGEIKGWTKSELTIDTKKAEGKDVFVYNSSITTLENGQASTVNNKPFVLNPEDPTSTNAITKGLNLYLDGLITTERNHKDWETIGVFMNADKVFYDYMVSRNSEAKSWAGFASGYKIMEALMPVAVQGTASSLTGLRYGSIPKATSSEVSVISSSDLLRIQNAATRINKTISVVGSRAKGTATAYSDWDYVIIGMTNKEWKKIKNSLPGAASRGDGMSRNIDVIKTPVWPGAPHVTVNPKTP